MKREFKSWDECINLREVKVYSVCSTVHACSVPVLVNYLFTIAYCYCSSVSHEDETRQHSEAERSHQRGEQTLLCV